MRLFNSLKSFFSRMWGGRIRAGIDDSSHPQTGPLQGGMGKGPAFSPALLEVLDAAPSPLGRMLGVAIMLLATVFMAWAIIAQMEIVVSAQGRVIPSGQVKVIQAAEAGTVAAIHVRDGQRVQKGDALVDIDDTAARADLLRLQQEHLDAQVRIAALQAQLKQDADAFVPPDGISKSAVDAQRRLLINRLARYQASLQVSQETVTERQADLSALSSRIEGMEQELPLLERQYHQYQELAETGAASEVERLNTRLEWMRARRELEVSRHQLKEARAALTSAQRDEERQRADFRTETLDDLIEATMTRDAAAQEIVKLRQRIGQMAVTAPVDGTVQQLSVNTVGGVVTTAQALMVIVPSDAGLEIDAQVMNRDIGPLHTGLPVKLKVDAYPFTRHGMLNGTLDWVGTDSIEDRVLGMVYPVRIRIDENELPNMVDGHRGRLTTGMSVTADIVVGKRRVIDYFISPLLRYRDESLREM